MSSWQRVFCHSQLFLFIDQFCFLFLVSSSLRVVVITRINHAELKNLHPVVEKVNGKESYGMK